MSNAEAKNIQRIVESIEAHDSRCEKKAKAVLLSPFEHERLGWDSVPVKGRQVPIKPDESLGTGRLRIVCDGYHGPKKPEGEFEEVVVDQQTRERELVPVGAPPDADEVEKLTGFKMTEAQRALYEGKVNPREMIFGGRAYGRRWAEEEFRRLVGELMPDVEIVDLGPGATLYRFNIERR